MREGRRLEVGCTYLGEVFADILARVRKVVAERAGITRLTGTLAEELARDVRGIWANPTC